MKISRVLNNNAVLGVENNVTYLLMGLSIGFKRSQGEDVASESVEKMFVLNDVNAINKLQQIVSFIPNEYLSFVSDMVVFAEAQLKQKLSDMLYVALTDHIYFSVDRYRKGIMIDNGLLSEIKEFYSKEFHIALQIVEKANQVFDTKFDENEASFISLHILNAEGDSGSESIQSMTRLIREILNIIKAETGRDFGEDDMTYSRLVTHLKYFSQKVFNKADDKASEDDEMYEFVKRKYKDAFNLVQKIFVFVQQTYGYTSTNMDQVYLTVHIARILNN